MDLGDARYNEKRVGTRTGPIGFFDGGAFMLHVMIML
jgi:hypothetical protein